MSSRIKATTEKFSNTGLADALKVEMMAGKVKPTELPANVVSSKPAKQPGMIASIESAANYTPFPAEVPSDAEIADLVAQQKAPNVEQASAAPTAIDHGSQRLVNRRLVKKPDFLRNGAPLDVRWAIEQVHALRDLKTPSHKIVAALDRVGVRRGDGSPITVADVERWGQEA